MSDLPSGDRFVTDQWTTLERKVLSRKASAGGERLRDIWHLNRGTRVRVVRLGGYEHLVVVESKNGAMRHALIPADAFNPVYRKAASQARHELRAHDRDRLIEAGLAAYSLGRLDELLPELSAWVTTSLIAAAEGELAMQVATFEVRGCWAGPNNNFTLCRVPRESRPLIWGDPDRRSLRLQSPSGVPRRRWQVGIAAVRNRLLEIGVASPSVLRPDLLGMATQLDGTRTPVAGG